MSGLFSQFSSAQRVGFGLALCVVATFLAWLSLRFAVAGPWYGFAVTLFVAAAFMSLGFSAWPDKLPAEVLVVKEQWDKAKAKSRSEEHTSELQSLMRISYAVFCLKKKKKKKTIKNNNIQKKLRHVRNKVQMTIPSKLQKDRDRIQKDDINN